MSTKRPEYDYRYSIIPGGAVTDENISMRDLQVLALLGRHTKRNGWCFRSQVEMAKEIRCGRATVGRSVKRLIEAGWVEVKALPRGRAVLKEGQQPFSAFAYRVKIDREDEDDAALSMDVPNNGHPPSDGSGDMSKNGQGVPTANGQGVPIQAGTHRRTDLKDQPKALAPAGASERWKEFRAAIVETWPSKFPSDDEAKARRAFERASETIDPATLIACARAHGAAKSAQKAKRSAPGEFLMKLPSNWLKECGFRGYADGISADEAAEAEIARGLGRTHSSMGSEMIEIFRRIGMTDHEMAYLAGASFLGGSQPCFTVVTPFQGSLLRRHASKLQRELGTEDLVIVLSGSERRIA